MPSNSLLLFFQKGYYKRLERVFDSFLSSTDLDYKAAGTGKFKGKIKMFWRHWNKDWRIGNLKIWLCCVTIANIGKNSGTREHSFKSISCPTLNTQIFRVELGQVALVWIIFLRWVSFECFMVAAQWNEYLKPCHIQAKLWYDLGDTHMHTNIKPRAHTQLPPPPHTHTHTQKLFEV